MTAILGNGIYTLPEAARLTKLKPSRLREWFHIKPNKNRKPVFKSDYNSVDGDRAISFLDLIDVFVAGQLREHRLSLQTLRRVYSTLRKRLDTAHPFARSELFTDGKQVFLRGIDDKGREELEEVLSRQRVFPKILLPFLKRVEYDEESSLAAKWHVSDKIVINPAVCFGKPIVEPVGISAEILAAEFEANKKDANLVAEWYGVHPSHVKAAVKFIRELAA